VQKEGIRLPFNLVVKPCYLASMLCKPSLIHDYLNALCLHTWLMSSLPPQGRLCVYRNVAIALIVSVYILFKNRYCQSTLATFRTSCRAFRTCTTQDVFFNRISFETNYWILVYKIRNLTL
jgi:hypothetical protein